MASKKTMKKPQRRQQRSTSNIFAMIETDQIKRFKEVFAIIDQDNDGIISKNDLRNTYNSLGINPNEADLDEMLAEAQGNLNFTMYLAMFGERLKESDPENVIASAFACLDAEGNGYLMEDELRGYLTSMGQRMTDDEIDIIFRDAKVKDQKLLYKECAAMLKQGRKDE